ncbi:MAG TPA: transporter substrate-binding domain-containing protein [Candidatus Cloacimonadota bacterium]|nr:transporter substrate-binding domain-containing protein [Candidatus Cloacimonadota bacterium]
MKRIIFCATLFLIILKLFSLQSMTFYTQEFKPYIYSENNKAVGPGAEMIHEACKKAGIEYKIIISPWRLAVKNAEINNNSGLFFIAKFKEREDHFEISESLAKGEYGFFVNQEYASIFENDFTKLKNTRVGVYGPSFTSESLNEFSLTMPLQIDMTTDDEAAFRKLENKRIESVYSNKAVGYSIIKDLKLKNVKYLKDHKQIIYHIGINKNADPETKKAFLNEIKKLKQKGIINNILKKYELNTM